MTNEECKKEIYRTIERLHSNRNLNRVVRIVKTFERKQEEEQKKQII